MKTISSSNIKRFIAAAALALAIPLTAVAFQGNQGAPGACGDVEKHGGHGRHARGGEMMPRHLHQLNLSEAQRDKVFEIMHGQAPAMRDQAKALHKAKDDLRALTAAPDYSETKAKSLADLAARAMGEMTLVRARGERQVYEVLTPEQRQQLAELKEKGESPRRGMAGERRGPAAC